MILLLNIYWKLFPIGHIIPLPPSYKCMCLYLWVCDNKLRAVISFHYTSCTLVSSWLYSCLRSTSSFFLSSSYWPTGRPWSGDGGGGRWDTPGCWQAHQHIQISVGMSQSCQLDQDKNIPHIQVREGCKIIARPVVQYHFLRSSPWTLLSCNIPILPVSQLEGLQDKELLSHISPYFQTNQHQINLLLSLTFLLLG